MEEKFTKILRILMVIGTLEIFIICGALCFKVIFTNKYDVNGDGIVSASDYVAVKNYIMEEK